MTMRLPPRLTYTPSEGGRINRRKWSSSRAGARPRALLLSTMYRPGPWCMNSLRASGFDAIGAEREGSSPAQGRSLACLRPLRFPAPGADPSGFADWLERTCAEREIDVVVPNSEDAVRVIAAHGPSLGRAVVAGPTAMQYARLCDKAGLAAASLEAGVTHPRTIVVTDASATALPAAPVIVKAALSGDSLQEELETVLASTDAQRDAAVARMLAAGSAALVQEFVTGVPWVVHGVRSHDGVLLVVAARVSALYPRVVGVSSISHSVPCPPPLLEDTRRLLDLVGYVGPFCTNALERDGRYFTHDVNLRVAASVALAVRAGLEVPGLGARAALGLPIPAAARRVGITYVNVDAETSALVDVLREGRGAGGESVTSAIRGTLSSMRGRRILDPSPADPVWIGMTAGRALRKAMRLPG